MVSVKFSLLALASAALSASAMKVMAGSPAAQALTHHNSIKGPGHNSRPRIGKIPRTGGKPGARPISRKPGHGSRPGFSKPSRTSGKPAARPVGPGVDYRPDIFKTPRTGGRGTTGSRNIIKRSVRTGRPVKPSGGISKSPRLPMNMGIYQGLPQAMNHLRNREMVEEILEELGRRGLELDELE